MGIEITSGPIDASINGTVVWFQGDPSATPEWDTLVNMNVAYKTPAERQAKLEALTDALAALTDSEHDAETLRKLVGPGVGVMTLRNLARSYIAEVTGFPTQPPPGSTRGGKKTTDT